MRTLALLNRLLNIMGFICRRYITYIYIYIQSTYSYIHNLPPANLLSFQYAHLCLQNILDAILPFSGVAQVPFCGTPSVEKPSFVIPGISFSFYFAVSLLEQPARTYFPSMLQFVSAHHCGRDSTPCRCGAGP